jgi:hypothetical protein
MRRSAVAPVALLASALAGAVLAIGQDAGLAVVETAPPLDGHGPSEFAPVASGPAHVLLAGHTDLALYRKSAAPSPAATLAARVNVREFFAALPGPVDRLTDPDVTYDPLADRFFVVYGDTTRGQNRLLMAVSKSARPAGFAGADWFFYALPRADSADEGDFDHLAVTRTRLLVSWQRTRLTPAGPLGDGTLIRVLDKRPFLDGTAGETLANLLIPSERNLRARPASIAWARDREGRDRVFYDVGSDCQNERWTWQIATVDAIETAPALQLRLITSPFSCLNAPIDVPQPGGAPRLRTSRLAMNPAYRDGRLWLFEWNDGARDGTTSALYWMELDVSRWPDQVSVVQSGVHREAGSYIHAAAGAVAPDGSAVLSYLGVGPAQFPVVRATGRAPIDEPGTLRPGITVAEATRAWQMPASRLATVFGAAVDVATGDVWVSGLLPVPTPPSGAFDSTRHVLARVRVQ